MNKKSLLLVDDDTTIRDVIKGALEKDYCVLEASGYADAVELLNCPIDLAIIDYILPDCDGFDVLRALREVDPEIPAIIITGHGDENVVIQAIRKDVADYIKKPVKLNYLRERLREIFSETDSGGGTEGAEAREKYILESVARHIEQKYMTDLTLEKVSRLACMSRFSFCRAFKERFGQTLISYLNGIRLKNALRLLRNSDYNITEIAHSVGYRTMGHFDRVFRAAYKVSPREYRKKVSGRIKNRRHNGQENTHCRR
jgi:YesN/AraC family two-component response regulator